MHLLTALHLASDPNWQAVATSVCFFAFVGGVSSLAIWTDARHKERAQLYRRDLLKKLAEDPGPGAEQVLALLRGEELQKQRRCRESLMLGGLILVMVAVGLIPAGLLSILRGPDHPRGEALWALGLIPLMIGLALLIHAKFVVGKSKGAG